MAISYVDSIIVPSATDADLDLTALTLQSKDLLVVWAAWWSPNATDTAAVRDRFQGLLEANGFEVVFDGTGEAVSERLLVAAKFTTGTEVELPFQWPPTSNPTNVLVVGVVQLRDASLVLVGSGANDSATAGTGVPATTLVALDLDGMGLVFGSALSTVAFSTPALWTQRENDSATDNAFELQSGVWTRTTTAGNIAAANFGGAVASTWLTVTIAVSNLAQKLHEAEVLLQAQTMSSPNPTGGLSAPLGDEPYPEPASPLLPSPIVVPGEPYA